MGLLAMFFQFNSRETQTFQIPAIQCGETIVRQEKRDQDQAAEARRLMYERIAEGNGLAEAEEAANRKWRGK